MSSCNVLHVCLAVIGWFLIVIIIKLAHFPKLSSVEQLSLLVVVSLDHGVSYISGIFRESQSLNFTEAGGVRCCWFVLNSEYLHSRKYSCSLSL